MTLWKWSTTANDNDDADTTVNLREGWAPSIVNNSIRALMAAVAKWRDDLSGNIVTGGTATAFTITTNQGLTSLTDGFCVTARMHTTSGANPTLAVDGLDAKNIRGEYGANIPDGALAEGRIYSFSYDNTDAGWIVHNAPPSTPDLDVIEALSGTGVARRTGSNTWALDDGTTHIIFIKDNRGSDFEAGVAGDIPIPYAATITGVFLYADQAGDLVLDLWKDSHANFPPTVADTITASAKPTLNNAASYSDTTLTGWTTSLSAGDILRVNIDSADDVSRFTLAIRIKRFI